MKTRTLGIIGVCRLILCFGLSLFATRLGAAPPAIPSPTPPAVLPVFLKLCDLACDELAKDTLHQSKLRKHHYKDAYSVRALAVAFDLTGNPRYLATCQNWADKMVQCQDGMTPTGAYYMNYGRRPGATTGPWFVADSASIAMGVLATAVRTPEGEQRAKYLRSVRTFADLVLARYVHNGGVINGLWDQYDGPWWCSTGTFGSLAFLLYDECGERKYLEAGLAAVDWLNTQDLATTAPLDLHMQGPALIMYFFEAYSAGLPHLAQDPARQAKATAQMDRAVEWMRLNLRGLGGTNPFSYFSQWGSKAGGLPFHLYVWSKYRPPGSGLAAQADAELAYTVSVLFDPKRLEEDKNTLSQLMNFAMLSMAEELRPGSVYRR